MQIRMRGRIMISPRRFLIFLLVFSSLVPDIGIKFSTLGFYWTFYRAAIFTGILIYLLISKKDGKIIRRTAYRKWILLMTAWIIYGAILLGFSPYRNLHKGFVELLSLFNGLVCVYVLISVIRNRDDVNLIFNTVCYVYLLMVALCVIEIVTGHHLPGSVLNDKTIGSVRNSKAATGIFYNENDLSAFLTCLIPVLFLNKKHKIFSVTAVLCVIYILHINDANICIMALIISVGYYFTFIKQYGKHGQAVLQAILITAAIVIFLYIWANIDLLANKISLLNVIRTQQIIAGQSQGSLFKRITIYSDSLKAALNTGLLGIGPAAFTNYFISHPSKSGLVDPHNLYLEILVEYGFIIASIFIICLVQLIRKCRKRIQQCKNKAVKRKLSVGCEMLILYSIVCIVSSSFIGYAWQWIVITIGITLVGIPETELVDEDSYYYIAFQQPTLLTGNNTATF